MKKILIVLFLSFFGCSILNAGPLENSKAIQTYFGHKKFLGKGTVYKFVIPAYDISLWVEGAKWSYNQLFALEVKARWDSCKKEMVDSTVEVMKRNTPISPEQEKEYTDFLNSFYPDLTEGDLITVVYMPNQKILFYHNNRLLAESKDMVFARAFCNIWLSPKTKYESARLSMLGEK